MSTQARFKGKSFVVTGAAQGIGRHVAIDAAAEGAQVTLVDRSQLVEEAGQEIIAGGVPSRALRPDLATYARNVPAIGEGNRRVGEIDRVISHELGRVWV